MTRISQDERELVRKAAEDAERLLPKLKSERDDLDKRIARLEGYAREWAEMNGRRAKDQGGNDVDATASEGAKARAKKGQVLAHIEAVLNTSVRGLEPSDLREAIKSRFDVDYGRSTIYNALRLAEKKNRLVQDGKKWKANPMLITNVTTIA